MSCPGTAIGCCLSTVGFDYNTIRNDPGFMKYDAIHCRCFRDYCFNNPPTKPRYRYFVTITKRPEVPVEQLEHVLQKIYNRSPVLEIKKLWYTKEHWDSNAHIHCYIESTRSCPRNRFTCYEKNCGHIDLKKAKGTLAQVEDYMTKESPIVRMLDE